jgi:hypothetical protein
MTDDLLDAECVIHHLCNRRVIVMRDWKSRHFTSRDSFDYSVYFDRPDTHGDVRLQIISRETCYFVPRSLVKILSFRLRFNAESIYQECMVA